jgi:hypothetical protein
MTVGDAFRRMGAEQWDAISARFGTPAAAGSKRSEAAE